MLCTLAGVLTASAAHAANFLAARYDPGTDELVVEFAYRGTNPDHQFTLQWDECRAADAEGSYEIAGRVFDSQWNDRALEPFTKTVRFDLRDLQCRPARATLFTAPNFRIGVVIPESPT
jgi:hypothetical protein